MTGFIKLHRKILDWEWWDDHNVTRTFLYLLIDANYTDKNWRGGLVKRGQIATSYQNISKATGLTLKQARTATDKLASTGEIVKKRAKLGQTSGNGNYLLIQIINYDDYQGKNEDGADLGHCSGSARAEKGQQLKKGRSEEGKKSITPLTPQGGESEDDFEQFWISFPRQRRGDKQVAQTKWNAALKKGYTVDQIMQGVTSYQHSREVAEGYAKNAASWLYNAKFLDNYQPPKNKAPEVNKWDEAREKIKRGEL